jgi:lipopolysaccharide transport system ATP-binding protein
MSRVVLKAEDISKQYRLGLVGTGTVRDDLKRWWYSVQGKEDPFLKIGEANNRATKGDSDYVWSLQDINFEINQGDSVGIIGRNGAGKSTLLKILSQVTQPTTGRIFTKGRIASLLEVGTGFHPEMTGRENIYLNGAILGMRKHEITRKLDEIIAFSGVERYIDTPVKRYSSGMYVRLAFAVAAHLESEILIVDEVLAVGDAEFQKKCLGKMGDISKGEGRTVLFVSHNMAAVKQLCTKIIVLENGFVDYEGNIDVGITSYLKYEDKNLNENSIQDFIQKQDDEIFILKRVFLSQDFSNQNNFFTNKKIQINYEFNILKEILGLRIGFDLIDLSSGLVVFRTFHNDEDIKINIMKKGSYNLCASIPENLLKEGLFAIKLLVGIHNNRWIIYDDKLMLRFNIINFDGLNSAFTDSRPGIIMPKLEWEINNN